MNTCLFIDTNGKIRVNEFPEKPEIDPRCGKETCMCNVIWDEYEAAVQSALDNGVELIDQWYGSNLLWIHHRITEPEPMKPYPIPYKMEVKLQVRHGVEWHDLPNQKEGRETDGIYRKLATLTLISNL